MAVNLDGTSEYYLDSVALTVRDNWTLCAQINIDALPTTGVNTFDMCVYNGADGSGGPNNGYGFGVGIPGQPGSNLIGLYGGIAWIEPGYTFASAGVWYQVVMSRNSGVLTFHVNGSAVGSTYSGSDNGTPSESFTIGAQDRNAEGNIWHFDGKICEVGAWDRGLGVGEIAALGKGYSPLFFPRNLKRYRRLLNTSDTRDLMSSGAITTAGTPDTFAHPRIIYPYGDPTGVHIPTSEEVRKYAR